VTAATRPSTRWFYPVELNQLQYPVTLVRIIYSFAIFVGSALLFLIQPMAAKLLLPTFGGSPAVWTSAMLFFQVALLGGYAYSHYSNRLLNPARQRFVHLLLLVGAVITLPFAVQVPENATTGYPPLLVFLMLATTVGLSYFAISAGSPTLQRWFATTADPAAKDPYFLYAISNVGSMVGLFAYPFYIERHFKLGEQAQLFRFGFIAMMVAMLVAAIFVRPQPQEETAQAGRLERKRMLRWILNAAAPSSLLLGVTNTISSNIAPIPLIWVVPLAAYLLSFIFAFASKRLVTAAQLSRILPLLVTPLAFTICIEATEPLLPLAILHISVFLIAAWFCHALLSEDRPDAGNLTQFYLCLSIGGALGGFFNSIVAPVVFPTFFEYPLVMCLILLFRPPTKAFEKQLGLTTTLVVASFTWMAAIRYLGADLQPNLRSGIALGVPLVAVFALVERTKVYAFGMLGLFFGSMALGIASTGKVLATHRSFFGVHRVVDGQGYRQLMHGNTIHGRQSLDPAKKGLPLTYYYPTGPIGSIFNSPDFMQDVSRVGLVGLGVGSLAVYGRSDQEFTYFEIDPTVLYLARDSGLFSFLKQSRARMNYVLGDARLTLAKQPDGQYGLLVLDAFSSDAIPTHLLTAEAIQMYASKLAPGGILAMHISNRYLELAPVVALTARSAGLETFSNVDAENSEEKTDGKTQSHWLLLTRDRGVLEKLVNGHTVGHPELKLSRIRPGIDWNEIDIPQSVKPWTDDYVDVLGAFKAGGD
jgi:hypothetical protein